MRIRKLAIAALIAAAATATAFAQSALDQSVPRVSPTTAPRVSPTPTDTSGNMGIRRERGTVTAPGGIPERAPVAAPPATRSDVVRDPRTTPGDTRAIGAQPSTR